MRSATAGSRSNRNEAGVDEELMMLSECSAIRRRRSEEDGDNRRAKIPPINRRADKFFRPQIIAAEIFSA